MNIILVSHRTGRHQPVSLSHRHVLLMAGIGLLFLPLFLSIVVFQIHGKVARYYGAPDASQLAVQQQQLSRLRTELAAAQGHAKTHLNALAQRMGHMQAQVLRLNALGERLTHMAKLDASEFDFSQEPAMGGPAGVSLSEGNSEFLKTLQALESLSEAIDRKGQRLTAMESLWLDRQVTAAVTPSGWPADGGWVSSLFGARADPFTGRRSYHEGVDIAARHGSVITAMGDGVVAYSGPKTGYGSLVEITHGQGFSSRYAHTSENLVKVGDRVTKGQPIAKVGSSGRSTGPHLHFEVLREGRAVDPQNYLNFAQR